MSEVSVCKFTKSAEEAICNIMKDGDLDKSKVYVRIQVVGMSCRGPQYSMGFTEEVDEKNDYILDYNGIKIAIDNLTFQHINGTTISYIDAIEGTGFKFDKPTNSCGGCCGC